MAVYTSSLYQPRALTAGIAEHDVFSARGISGLIGRHIPTTGQVAKYGIVGYLIAVRVGSGIATETNIIARGHPKHP